MRLLLEQRRRWKNRRLQTLAEMQYPPVRRQGGAHVKALGHFAEAVRRFRYFGGYGCLITFGRTAVAGGRQADKPIPRFELHPGPRMARTGIIESCQVSSGQIANVPVHALTITSGFWAARRRTNVENSIPSMEKLLEANGRMDNFLRLSGKSDAPQRGPVFSYSDVYKWTEAAGFALQSGEGPELRKLTDKIIKEAVAVQEPSGYQNTYYVGERAKDRMTPEVQRWGHELHNIGHLLQDAIAYYRATGERTLLDAGIRAARPACLLLGTA